MLGQSAPATETQPVVGQHRRTRRLDLDLERMRHQRPRRPVHAVAIGGRGCRGHQGRVPSEDVAQLHRHRRHRRVDDDRSRAAADPRPVPASRPKVSERASSMRWSPDSPQGGDPQSIHAVSADVDHHGERSGPASATVWGVTGGRDGT